MTTPIDRESVERLANWLRDDDLHEAAQHHVAGTLLALRAALDEADAALDSAHAGVGSNIWRYWRVIARDHSFRRQETEAENEKLRETLKLADLALRGCNIDMGHLLRKVTAALQEKTND